VTVESTPGKGSVFSISLPRGMNGSERIWILESVISLESLAHSFSRGGIASIAHRFLTIVSSDAIEQAYDEE